MKRRILLAATVLAGFGLWQTGEAAWIHAKAWLAYGLIDRAWQRTRAGDHDVPPWPGADFWPVAKLRFPAQDRELVVLSNATGRTLAFGPGQLAGTADPGREARVVIAGHRDTHFTILRTLDLGAVVEIENRHGASTRYRVTNQFVITSDELPVLNLAVEPALTLLTCHAASAFGPTIGWLVLEARPEAIMAGKQTRKHTRNRRGSSRPSRSRGNAA